VKDILLEGLLVGLTGALLAFAANAVSCHGLKLTRNYSPGGALAISRANPGTTNSDQAGESQLLEKQLAAEGLQLIDSQHVIELFNDPAKQQGLIIFVDARKDEHFLAGHIPGAYQLDHYYPEKYLAQVLPACQVAQKIVVYCKGGTCEDSEQTAIFLRDAGIPKERLFVYAGGFDDWSAQHRPVETGDPYNNRSENKPANPMEQTPK
jgi:rhodanese-related sulfurtransferase